MHQIHRKMKWLVNLWLIWDRFILTLFQIKPLDGENSFLKVRVHKYRGKDILLREGGKIRKGDRVIELHLNNEYLLQLGSSARSTVQLSIQLIRLTEHYLPKVTEYINHHPHGEKIIGIYGISMIHRGAKQFGFTVMDLPKGLCSFLTRVYLRLLFVCLHPDGIKSMTKRHYTQLMPMVIAISKKELFQRYSIECPVQVHAPIILFSDSAKEVL